MKKREGSADPGNAEWSAHDRSVRNDVAEKGYHLGLVPALERSSGWAFSVGLPASSGHPELICFGPDVPFVGQLVQHLCEAVVAGRRFEEDTPVEGILSERALRLRPVDNKWLPTFLGNAAYFHDREDFPALQCFWPDRSGLFPWQAGFDSDWREAQPLLFEALTHKALPETLVAALIGEGAL